MIKREFPPSKVPRFDFAELLEEQEQQLASNPLVLRLHAARRAKAVAPHRPFYQAVPPEETRWH